jgi:hypothetical protein
MRPTWSEGKTIDALADAQHFPQPIRQQGRRLELDAACLPLAEVVFDRNAGPAGPTVERTERLDARGSAHIR